MLFNFAAGFVLPWILGAFLYRRDRNAVLLALPIAAVVAFTVCQWGSYTRKWYLLPILPVEQAFSALPVNIGYFPVWGSCYFYALRHFSIGHLLLTLGFSVVNTIFEVAVVLIGHVMYDNGWNVLSTFGSYLLAYGIGYAYYRALLHHDLI